MDSILLTIKKLIGISAEDESFDADVIVCINSVLSILTQLGVGLKRGFSISDSSTTWNDYIGSDDRLEMVISFIHLRVRLLFDPPQNASLAEAIEKMAKELEWRIQVEADPVYN